MTTNAMIARKSTDTMTTAAQFQKKLQPLLNLQRLQEIAAKEIVKESDTIADRKEAEFKMGDRPDGSEIGVYRNSAYARYKNALNPAAGGYVDLTLSGRFAGSAYLRKPKNGKYLLEFSDNKAATLL